MESGGSFRTARYTMARCCPATSALIGTCRPRFHVYDATNVTKITQKSNQKLRPSMKIRCRSGAFKIRSGWRNLRGTNFAVRKSPFAVPCRLFPVIHAGMSLQNLPNLAELRQCCRPSALEIGISRCFFPD